MNKYIDNSGDKKYFAIIPYYIVNHSTAYEQSLYLVMKRLAGENGTCYASLTNLAKRMGVSRATTHRTLQKIIERSWIKFLGSKPSKTCPSNEYEIVNLWEENLNYIKKTSSPEKQSQEEEKDQFTRETETSSPEKQSQKTSSPEKRRPVHQVYSKKNNYTKKPSDSFINIKEKTLKEEKEKIDMSELKESSDAIKLTQLLFDLIKERKIDFKTPNLDKWASEMDRIIRIDHRSPETIEAVIRWCQADDFWQDNILSAKKLRKQFDQLEMKMKKDEYMKLPKHTRNNIATYQQIAAEEGWDD